MNEEKNSRRLHKRARAALAEFRMLKRRSGKFKKREPGAFAVALAQEDALARALAEGDAAALPVALSALEETIGRDFARFHPNQFAEFIKALIMAMFIAFFIRWGLIEPFRIPSGSMIPTLLIGDQLMVNKTVFGPDIYIPYLDPPENEEFRAGARAGGCYPIKKIELFGHRLALKSRKMWVRRLPRRGEIVVFRYPHDPSQDYIKRVIGLPGDKIEIGQGILYINDLEQPATLTGDYTGPAEDGGCETFELFEEGLLNDGGDIIHPLIHCQDSVYSRSWQSFGPVTVPEGHLFMMGDNRDYSSDSRSWGTVPVANLKGVALFIHLPLDPAKDYIHLRTDRLFKWIR